MGQMGCGWCVMEQAVGGGAAFMEMVVVVVVVEYWVKEEEEDEENERMRRLLHVRMGILPTWVAAHGGKNTRSKLKLSDVIESSKYVCMGLQLVLLSQTRGTDSLSGSMNSLLLVCADQPYGVRCILWTWLGDFALGNLIYVYMYVLRKIRKKDPRLPDSVI